MGHSGHRFTALRLLQAALAAKAGIAPITRNLQPQGEVKPGKQSVNTWGLGKQATEVGPATEGLSWECSAGGVGGGKARSRAAGVPEVMGGCWGQWERARASAVAEARPAGRSLLPQVGSVLAGRVALQAGLEGIQAVLQCKHRQRWGRASTAEGSDCEELGWAVTRGAQGRLLWLSWVQLN